VVLYSSDGALPVERWHIKPVGQDTETSVVVDNTSTSDWFVRVQARNSHGFGPKSDVVRFRVTPQPPSTDLGMSPTRYRAAKRYATPPTAVRRGHIDIAAT